MSVRRQIDESLAQLTFAHREENYHHLSYEEEMHQYELLKLGDLSAVEEAQRKFTGPNMGILSDDPVRNYQYLFVASITVACRFCMEGGMPTEEAFNLSDLYIRQVDKCADVQSICALHGEMMTDYGRRMQRVNRGQVYSRPVYQCLDYIDQHLQEPLTVALLAEQLGLSASYLSVLFKRETRETLSGCIRRKRVDTAKTLLQYTQYTSSEIAEYLCFSTDSHFSRIFRRYTGLTPGEYRKRHFRKHWEKQLEK